MRADEAARLRREYETEGLHEGHMAEDPFNQFRQWFSSLERAELDEPNAFVLATADSSGKPSARALLMKGFSEAGLVFYTNLEGRKSQDLRENPQAAATFVWIPLHRQVRFEGSVELIPGEDADVYFASRPRGAQLGAHASAQSEIVSSRSDLERRFEEEAHRFDGREVPRPDMWGGWRLIPESVEFWQGQVNRFHDRVRYRRSGGGWIKERLSP